MGFLFRRCADFRYVYLSCPDNHTFDNCIIVICEWVSPSLSVKYRWMNLFTLHSPTFFSVWVESARITCCMNASSCLTKSPARATSGITR